jgi:hypothetical protein
MESDEACALIECQKQCCDVAISDDWFSALVQSRIVEKGENTQNTIPTASSKYRVYVRAQKKIHEFIGAVTVGRSKVATVVVGKIPSKHDSKPE